MLVLSSPEVRPKIQPILVKHCGAAVAHAESPFASDRTEERLDVSHPLR